MASRRIYASSNGDKWDLVREDDDRVFVLYTPNLDSGGLEIKYDLVAFLSHEGHTAQNVALVRLIGTLADDGP